MCLRATIRRPLRSKRAMISPVRPRVNASGFTRMRVRSMRLRCGSGWAAGGGGGGVGAGGGRAAGGGGGRGGWGGGGGGGCEGGGGGRGGGGRETRGGRCTPRGGGIKCTAERRGVKIKGTSRSSVQVL